MGFFSFIFLYFVAVAMHEEQILMHFPWPARIISKLNLSAYVGNGNGERGTGNGALGCWASMGMWLGGFHVRAVFGLVYLGLGLPVCLLDNFLFYSCWVCIKNAKTKRLTRVLFAVFIIFPTDSSSGLSWPPPGSSLGFVVAIPIQHPIPLHVFLVLLGKLFCFGLSLGLALINLQTSRRKSVSGRFLRHFSSD